MSESCSLPRFDCDEAAAILKRLFLLEGPLTVLATYRLLLANRDQRALVEYFEIGFRERVIPVRNELRRGVIHNDANRGNLLVNSDGSQVISIIDFGDMVNSWLVVEPSIAASYAMLDQADPLDIAQKLLAGYHKILPLTATEIGLAFDLFCMRLCMSVCICAHQSRLEPDNEYLRVDARQSWALLRVLQAIDHNDAREALLVACELA